MGPSRRFVIIIFTLSLLKFQELKGERTTFNQICAPLFDQPVRYQNCGMEQLRSVIDCCARRMIDFSTSCKHIMTLDEMETALGENLELSDITTLYSPHAIIGTRHIDFAVRYVVDRGQQLQGTNARYYYVPSALTSALIGRREYNRYNEINFLHLRGRVLIMPFVIHNHWMVMIVHTARKVIRYYDSLDPLLHNPVSIQNANLHKEVFMSTLQQRNKYVSPSYTINTSDWSFLSLADEPSGVITAPCNESDCGIHALMFIEEVLNLQLPVHPSQYRQYLIETIGNHNHASDLELVNRSRYYYPIQINTPNGPMEVSSCAR